MQETPTAGSTPPGRWDPLVRELHRLREAAGTPSYDRLTRMLVAQRIADGLDEHAAHIAKSSVHDAFRHGRSRINEALVRELVRVLDGDPADVDTWVARCTIPVATPSPENAPDPVTPATPAPPVAHADPSPAHAAALMTACLAVNLLGREFVDFFAFPVYLDMVGTAVAAIALGPWRGAAVGLGTNVLGIVGSGWISLPFALVNVVGALVWGYGVHRFGMARTLARYLALNLLAAVACTAVAVPILLSALHDQLRAGHDSITVLVEDATGWFAGAVALSNLLTSSADKLLSGFVALVVVSSLPVAFRVRSRLVVVTAQP